MTADGEPLWHPDFERIAVGRVLAEVRREQAISPGALPDPDAVRMFAERGAS